MRFPNAKKDGYLKAFPQATLDDLCLNLRSRCKFNFSYFEKQIYGKEFSEISPEDLVKLLDKLKHYSRESLQYWQQQPCGSHGHILEIYKNFPRRSDFTHPKSIPHQVWWGRFRLDQEIRLAGFVIPDNYLGEPCTDSRYKFDTNTFYVVFYDAGHRFYITEKK